MDRRNFLESVAGGALLAGAPVLVRHAFAMPASPAPSVASLAPGAKPIASAARDERVVVVHRGDLPGAAALAAAIAGSLRKAGTPATLLDRRAGDLASFASIDTVLRDAHGARIAGVMDDAAALLFQQLAASHGAVWLVEGRHRFDDTHVRHRLHAAGLAPAPAWSEPVGGWAPRIARHYTEIVMGRTAREGIGAGAQAANGRMGASELSGNTNPTSLVSFVIDLQEIHNGRPAR